MNIIKKIFKRKNFKNKIYFLINFYNENYMFHYYVNKKNNEIKKIPPYIINGKYHVYKIKNSINFTIFGPNKKNLMTYWTKW